ncbi:hypothetical protein ASG81_26975 [Paenibacillus sp. Soil522]|nr:hypothetical protein ASG81_26975 [Paenibacillus sp. Soil522]
MLVYTRINANFVSYRPNWFIIPYIGTATLIKGTIRTPRVSNKNILPKREENRDRPYAASDPRNTLITVLEIAVKKLLPKYFAIGSKSNIVR